MDLQLSITNQSTKPYNKHLISLVCSVRTASYRFSFFPYVFSCPSARRLSHKRKEKTRSITCRRDRANEANKRYLYLIGTCRWVDRYLIGTHLSKRARETACLEVNIRSYYLRLPSWILLAREHGLEFEIGDR